MRARAGLIAIVVVAGLIAAFLYFDLKPRRPNLPAYHYGERTSADYQAGGANCEPHALASIRDNRKAAMQRKHCAEAVEEHRLKSEDLVQQARAADAAQVQAATNYDLARMALWGTIGGFLTLIAAAIAAYFAREAAATAGEHLRHAANESRPFLIFGPLRLELDTRRGMFGQWGSL